MNFDTLPKQYTNIIEFYKINSSILELTTIILIDSCVEKEKYLKNETKLLSKLNYREC